MMKAFKYRLYPTRNQRDTLQFILDRNRELYNAALEERREAYRMSRISISYNDQSAQLPAIKEVCKRYDSFTYPQIEKLKGKPTVTIKNGKVILPKIGHIKVKDHRPIEGKTKTATIKREGDCWYIVFTCEVEAQLKLPYTDLPIGIDMGLKHFMTDSDGDVVDNPRFFRRSHGRLKKKQQRLSKRRNKSHRRKRSAQIVGRTHKKVRNQRRDFHQKEARILVETFETIVFEDLSMHHMVKRPKVKQDENGNYLHNGAAAKGGLNKSILDAGWASFIELVKHKAEYAGVTVYEVDPRKTSQICSACHTEGEHKDLSVRTHMCEYCVNWTLLSRQEKRQF